MMLIECSKFRTSKMLAINSYGFSFNDVVFKMVDRESLPEKSF